MTLRSPWATVLPLVVLHAVIAPDAGAQEPSKAECVSANESAQSLRQVGRLRDARAQLLLCVATTCPQVVRDDCTERLAALENALPTVVFSAKDAAGNAVRIISVAMDGASLATALDGTPLAVDVGEHTFRLENSAGVAIERKLVVREGEKARREDIVFDVPHATRTETSEIGRTDSSGNTQRATGLAVGGAGVVGMIVGSIFALKAKSTYDEALTHCPSGPTSCDATGAQEGRSAHTQATASTIAFAAGGAFLAGGIALYLTTPTGHVGIAPGVETKTAGVRLMGFW